VRFLQITKLFYYIYTLYTLLIVLISDYPIRYAVLGIAVMWMMYGIVFIGYKTGAVSQKKINKQKAIPRKFFFSSIQNWTFTRYLLNAGICWMCTILAAKYYTNKGFIQVINSMLGSGGAYQAYQAYFRSANIATLSIQKIPYILMLAYLTIMLFWSLISIVQLTAPIRRIQYFYVTSVTLAYLYFGVSRGTNFELYIVFILISYCLLNKQKSDNTQRLNSERLILVGILGCILIALFLIIVGARGGSFSYNICGEIQYDPQRMLSKLFPKLTIIMKSLFSYLGFGIYTIGVSFCDIIPQSTISFVSFLLPGKGILNNFSIVDQLKDSIEMGVRWTPDLLLMIDNYGCILSIVVWGSIGRIAAKLQTFNIPTLLKELISVILYIQMLSFPVGNFLGTSTPNKIFILFVLLCFVCTKVRVVIRH